MLKRIVFIIGSVMLLATLAACQDEKGLTINTASVEFGSLQDRDDRGLHFRVDISDYGMEPQKTYHVRFAIEDSYVRELVGAEIVEVPETYETLPLSNGESAGLITGTSVDLLKAFDPEKLRKVIGRKNAVTVEVYSGDEVFDRKDVDTFREHITPAAEFSTKVKIEKVIVSDSTEIAIVKKALEEMTKKEGSKFFVKPDYQIDLGNESYYLWKDGTGSIMKVNDPYMLYSLPTQSLNEILQIIGNKIE